MDPSNCSRCPEIIESVGALKEGQVFTNDTLKAVREKIDKLTMNGFAREKHDAVVDAEHKVEQRALRGHTWGYSVAVVACGAAGAWVLQTVLPQLFKLLGGK